METLERRPPKMKAHDSWLLTVIIFSIVFSLAIFGIFIPDSFGRHSHFVAPPSCLLTAIFHVISLFLWRKTSIERQGRCIPPSIYSIVGIILTGLLAVLWLAFSVLTAFFVAIEADERFYRRGWSFTHEIIMAIIGMTLSFVGTTVLWAEFVILVHYRKRFLRNAKRHSQDVKPNRRQQSETPEPKQRGEPAPQTKKTIRAKDVHGSAQSSPPRDHAVQRSHFWSFAPPAPVRELQTQNGTTGPELKPAGLREVTVSQPKRRTKLGQILRGHSEDFIVEKVSRETASPDPRQKNEQLEADPNIAHNPSREAQAGSSPRTRPTSGLGLSTKFR